ncbi:hypothetical protein F4X86_03690 [Candidatus Saccharibacteria bacterium]|nr:hypothetical protein [Candidatus Saccharibacteria bacterium]
MSERLNQPESPELTSLLTVPAGELICEPLTPFNLCNPEYLYENIKSSGGFNEVFGAIDGRISSSLFGCRPEELVKIVAASEQCPAAKTGDNQLEKRLCRYLEDTFDPVQSIRVILDATDGKPVRAVIEFDQNVLSNQTATIELDYGADETVKLKTTTLRVPAGSEQKPLTIGLEEDHGDRYFIRRTAVIEHELVDGRQQSSELSLEKRLNLLGGQEAKTGIIHRLAKRTRDKLSGEIIDEESRFIR